MQDFPNEIWIIILSFLPVRELSKLVGINRFLFHTAMEYIYSILEYDSSSMGTVVKINSQLRYPGIASRVRTLSLHLILVPVYSEEALQDLTSQASNTAHVIQNLTKLRELSIRTSGRFPVQLFLPILHGLVNMLRGRTLDKLRLEVEFVHTRAIFLPFVPSLVNRWTTKPICIRSLELVFPDLLPPPHLLYKHKLTPDDEIPKTYRRCIGAFLQYYGPSITRLGVTFFNPDRPGLVFQGLSFLNGLKLSRLNIRVYYPYFSKLSDGGIRSFLTSQRGTLKHLTIRYCGPPITRRDFFQDVFYPHNLLELVNTVPLSNLDTLDLATAWFFSPSSRSPETVFLPSSPNKVTSLFLEDAYCLPDNVNRLLREVTEGFPMLNHLTLAICVLTPKVLRTLSTRLASPALCLHLKLPDHHEVEPYIYDQIYPRWELEQFKITRACQQCHEDVSVEKQLVDALTRCLPLIHVESDDKCRCSASSFLRQIADAAAETA